jgi:two-component system sensor histidine kinase UhpB
LGDGQFPDFLLRAGIFPEWKKPARCGYDTAIFRDDAMSLRAQFIISVVLALVLSLAAEGALASWQARQSVENEMRLALDAGDRIVDNALLSLPAAGTDAYLTRLVRSFDDNRHVRVTLIEDGHPSAQSQIAPPEAVPGWFLRLLEIPQERREDFAPRLAGTKLVVESDPRNEIRETWEQFRDGAFSIALFSLMVLGLLHLAMSRIQAPLAKLRAGFGALGGGDHAARVHAKGPRETAELALAFNRMAERLQQVEGANARMSRQMVAIQEEERAELARELHDEMGPFLFAMRVDAEGIEKAAWAAGETAIAQRACAIGEAVTHIQRHVRAILKELRPADFAGFGLAVSIENLARFWRRHVDGIAIVLDIAEAQDGFGAEADAAIYRLVQEGLTNAARHGGAKTVWIAIKDRDGAVTVTVDDDGAGLAAGANFDGGLGLKGMRERLAGLGAEPVLGVRPGGGLRLTATIVRARARRAEPVW